MKRIRRCIDWITAPLRVLRSSDWNVVFSENESIWSRYPRLCHGAAVGRSRVGQTRKENQQNQIEGNDEIDRWVWNILMIESNFQVQIGLPITGKYRDVDSDQYYNNNNVCTEQFFILHFAPVMQFVVISCISTAIQFYCINTCEISM